MATLASLTGLRESELLALQWGDFDFERKTISVKRGVYHGKMREPKTEKSARELPLHLAVERAVCGLPKRSEYVFASPQGGVYEPSSVVRRIFKPTAKDLGLPPVTWRSFRRSAESAMHNAGVPLKAQQEILGHTEVNTTLIYAETNETGKREAVEELGKLIFPKFSQDATPVACG